MLADVEQKKQPLIPNPFRGTRVKPGELILSSYSAEFDTQHAKCKPRYVHWPVVICNRGGLASAVL